jgi:hypothetical protein
MSNELITIFKFETAQGLKEADRVDKRLSEIDSKFGTLGNSAKNFGVTLGTQMNSTNQSLKQTVDLTTKSIAQEKSLGDTKKNNLVTEKESLKIEQDKLKAKTEAAKITINSPYLEDIRNRQPSSTTSSPQSSVNSSKGSQPESLAGFADLNRLQTTKLPFAETFKSGLADIDARINQTKKTLDNFVNTRTQKGQFDLTTQGAIVAQKELDKLTAEYARFQAQAAKKGSGQFSVSYNNDLRSFENRIEQATKKVQNFQRSAGSSGGGLSEEHIGRIRGFGALFREYGGGVNEGEINAGLSVAEMAGIGTAGVAAFGAIAAAGLLVVKVTQSIKEEAQKHLKVEETIASTVNRQIYSQIDALRDLKKARENAQEDRQFSRDISYDVASISQLEQRKKTLEQLQKLIPAEITGQDGKLTPNETFRRNSEQLKALDAQIDADKQRRIQDNANSTRQQAESFSRSQDQAVEYERNRKVESSRLLGRRIDQTLGNDPTITSYQNALKIFNTQKGSLLADDQVAAQEKLTGTFKKLKEAATDLSGFLSSQRSQENPFARVLGEIDTVGERAEKRFHSLGQAAVDLAAKTEKSTLKLELFKTRLDNKLEAQSLRDQSEDLRNFDRNRLRDYSFNLQNSLTESLLENFKNGGVNTASVVNRFKNAEVGKVVSSQISDIIAESLKYQSSARERDSTFGGLAPSSDIGLTERTVKEKNFGTFYRYDLTNGLDKVYEKLGGGGTFSRQKTFQDLTDKERLDYLDSLNKTDPRTMDARERIDRQISTIQNLASGEGTKGAQDAAYKKIAGLADGLDLSKLNNNERSAIAYAKESLASQKDNYEKDIYQYAKDTRDYVKTIAEVLAQNGIKIDAKSLPASGPATVRIINDAGKNVDYQKVKTPTPQDTADAAAEYQPKAYSTKGGLVSF